MFYFFMRKKDIDLAKVGIYEINQEEKNLFNNIRGRRDDARLFDLEQNWARINVTRLANAKLNLRLVKNENASRFTFKSDNYGRP